MGCFCFWKSESIFKSNKLFGMINRSAGCVCKVPIQIFLSVWILLELMGQKRVFRPQLPTNSQRGTEAPQILRTTDLSTSLLAQQFRPFIKWKIKCVGSGVNQQGSNPSSTHWISYWSLHFFISLSCPWKVSGRANRIMNVKNFSTLALCQ